MQKRLLIFALTLPLMTMAPVVAVASGLEAPAVEQVEEQITKLQATIRTATVVADDEITTEKVSIGTIVKVKDLDDGETYEYAIVGANEADPMENKISNESPVGAGLIGAKKNQTVTILIPAGTLRYKITSIKKIN